MDIREEYQYKPLTNWANEPLQADLQKDYDAAQSAHSMFVARLETYRENMEGGKVIKARPGKSTVRPLLIRKQAEWKYPALAEPFLNTQDMFQIKPRTGEDSEAAKQNMVMLNYYWATKINKVNLIDNIIKTVVDEGTVIVKTGWHSEEELIEVEKEQPRYAGPEESVQLLQQAVQSGEMQMEQAQAMMQTGEPMQIGVDKITVEENKLVENHPTYEVCSSENVIVDPTCDGNILDAQFIIHEYELDLNTLKREELKTNEDGSTSGTYKNLKYIDFDADNELYDEYTSAEKSSFIFSDKARKKVKVLEYWGYWDIDGNDTTTAIVATWIGDVMVRLEENPFPHKRLPFSAAVYMPRKKEFHGEPDGELLRENQESIGKMTRAAHDITATQAIGQRLVNEQLFSSPSQWDAWKKGNDARFRADMDPKKDIHKENVEPVSNSVFQMIEMQNSDAESLTATKSFSQGVSGQALGASATGIRSALDATSKRELSILRRLSTQLFQDMAAQTVVNIQAYAKEEEVIRITDSEFVTVRRQDLQGEFDLKIEVSTPEKDNEQAEQLMKLMQTNQANMNIEFQKMMYSKLMNLWKHPDLAEQIETFDPQPDPAEEQMKQMQMQNMELEQQKLKMEIAALAKNVEESDSRIAERMSRVTENGVDVRNKNAQASLREAQAMKMQSETDVIDQGFLASRDYDSEGAKHGRELEKLDHKMGADRAKHDMDMEKQEHSRLSKLDELALKEQFNKNNKKQGV